MHNRKTLDNICKTSPVLQIFLPVGEMGRQVSWKNCSPLRRLPLVAALSCGVCLPATAAFAACTNSPSPRHYHVTAGSTCTYDASTTDTSTPYPFNGNNYTAIISASSNSAVMNVTGAGSTMNVLVDAYIQQSGGGARHAIQVTGDAFLNATGNLVAVSYNSTNSRALYTAGTVTVGGNLETYRYGSGGTAGLQVESTGVLNVTGHGYVYSAAAGVTGFRSYGTSHFGGDLTIDHVGQSATVAAGPYALNNAGGAPSRRNPAYRD